MDINVHNKPYLELIIGPMFSGKTTHLILLYKLYTLSNKTVCVINYSEDKRYHDNKVSSHDKSMIDSTFNVDNLNNIDIEMLLGYDVFLINEGQFFTNIYDFTKNLVETHKKIVYITGLDGNYKREAFDNGCLLKLIPLCDNVIKKRSLCKKCNDGTSAMFTHRITNDKTEKLIGINEYIPLCRTCYLSYNNT